MMIDITSRFSFVPRGIRRVHALRTKGLLSVRHSTNNIPYYPYIYVHKTNIYILVILYVCSSMRKRIRGGRWG